VNDEAVFTTEELNQQLHKDVQNISFITIVRSVFILKSETRTYMSLTVLKSKVSFGIITDSHVAVEYT